MPPSLSAPSPRRTERASSWRRIGGTALDLLLPPRCAACDAPVGRQGEFCAACFTRLDVITAPFCHRCAVPFAADREAGPAGLCPACIAHPPQFRRTRAAFLYAEGARRLILPFKHGDQTGLAPVLAARMARAGAELLVPGALLVPVPLHRWRLFRRRYNQAALLARALARQCGLAVCPDALVRVRPTAALDDRGAAERRAILAGAIAVRPARRAAVAGRAVVLIDDVMTSGATANACAAALAGAGAASVDVLVAARVPGPEVAAAQCHVSGAAP